MDLHRKKHPLIQFSRIGLKKELIVKFSCNLKSFNLIFEFPFFLYSGLVEFIDFFPTANCLLTMSWLNDYKWSSNALVSLLLH